MGKATGFALTLAMGIAWAGSALHASAPLTAEQAREEVDAIYGRIAESHPDPYWHTPRATWEAQLAELRRRTGPIDHVRHYFDLSRLMGLAFDTHTQIYPEADTPGFETSYPIRFRLFEEGLFVTAADDPYRDWVGARVLALAGRTPEAALGELGAYAFADHELRRISWAAEYLLPQPAVYRYLGWVADDGSVPLTLEMPDGGRIETALAATIDQSYDAVLGSGSATAYYWPEGWRTLADLSDVPPPVSRRHLDRNYWAADLDDGRAVYIQLNRPFNADQGETMVQFILRVFRDIATRETSPERLVIDLRYDLGGSISYSLPIAYIAQALDMCCTPGTQMLLVGRETVSAGSVLVGEFERTARPVVIGEPTGSRPNIFFRHEQIALPHSGLFAEASTARYIATVPEDERMYNAPDILVPERIADVIAGRDLALEAALAVTTEQGESFYSRGRDYRGWLRPSQDPAWPDGPPAP